MLVIVQEVPLSQMKGLEIAIMRRGSGPVCIGRPDISIRQFLSHGPMFPREP